MAQTTPIKRHQALVSFSRDHHYGLLLVWKVRQGIKKSVDPRRIADYVLFAFEADLEPHFRNEENWLFPRLEKGNEGRQRAESDHAAMRQVVEALKAGKGEPLMLADFADLLESHIRFEERDLFNELQKLPEEKLAPIAEHFTDHFCAADDGWQDPFWMQDDAPGDSAAPTPGK